MLRRNMMAASQRGRSHAFEGTPRDDDFALHFDENTGCYIMIVADGAGSARYSRRGSELACSVAMNVCREKLLADKDVLLRCNQPDDKNTIAKLMQEIIGNAVFESYKAIEKEAPGKNAQPKDYATTLLLTVCKRYDYGWFVAAWWVGDGGIGIYDRAANSLKVPGEPDGGEFAGQTRFLTMPDIIRNELYQRIRFEIVEDFTAIVLMTDGVTDPKFETDANLKRIEKWNVFWDDLHGNNEEQVGVDFSLNDEEAASQLLRWLDFWSKGNHDDRTIALLY
jgi:serine/threonine protein phosphatase PrpC